MTDKIKDIINNFSDMKIIKALECCIIGDCDNCPFYETRELCPNLILFVSDLIKRQKAEIEAFINGQETLQKYIAEQKAEIERFENHIQEGIDLAKQIPEMMELVKSEAYRECIEKVKERLSTCVTDTQQMVVELRLDNLLKELVGEDDG